MISIATRQRIFNYPNPEQLLQCIRRLRYRSQYRSSDSLDHVAPFIQNNERKMAWFYARKIVVVVGYPREYPDGRAVWTIPQETIMCTVPYIRARVHVISLYMTDDYFPFLDWGDRPARLAQGSGGTNFWVRRMDE